MASSINSLSSDSIQPIGGENANTQAQAELAQIQTEIARLRESMRMQDRNSQSQIETIRIGVHMVLSRVNQLWAKQNIESDFFPLVRGPIRMQDENTRAQMATAQLCIDQIADIQEMAKGVKRASKIVSKAERRLELIEPFVREISNRGLLSDYDNLTKNALAVQRRAEYFINALEAHSRETRNQSTLEHIKALLPEARNACTEAQEMCARISCKFKKIVNKSGYTEITNYLWKAQDKVRLANYKLDQAKQPWREALNSLKIENTDPPRLKGRCIEVICGAISPTCTKTDLTSLPIPKGLQSDIATFCDAFYLVRDEQ